MLGTSTLIEGDTFSKLLKEAFMKLAEAHAAEVRRAQSGQSAEYSLFDEGCARMSQKPAVPTVEAPPPRLQGEVWQPLPAGTEFELTYAKEGPAPQQLVRSTPHPGDKAVDAESITPAIKADRKADPSLSSLRAVAEPAPCNGAWTQLRPSDEGSALVAPSKSKTSSLSKQKSYASDSLVLRRTHTTTFNVVLHAIEITISSAEDLRDADLMLGTGTSDPYCTCQVRGKPDTRIATNTINDNCNPVWNFHCVIEDFEEDDTLEFKVFDSDLSLHDDLLGWVDMESDVHFPQGFDGVLDLATPRIRASDKPTLTVKVMPRDLMVEPDDEDTTEALRKLLELAEQQWPQIMPSSCLSLRRIASDDVADQRTGQAEESLNHGTIVVGHHRLERMLVLNPHSHCQVCWDILSAWCICFDIFNVPFVVSFREEPKSQRVMSLLTTVYWTLDIFRSAFCGYYRDGIIEMRLHRVMLRYLKSWFLLDVSLVTMDWVGVLLSMGQATSLTKMLRMLHGVRILRAIRVARVLPRLERISYSVREEAVMAVGALMAIMFVMLVFCHLLGCGFYSLGLESTSAGIDGWVVRDDVREQGLVYAYSTSIHWALTQFMPASSGINPGNEYERVYVLLVDILGFICFSFFVSNVQMELHGLKKLSSDAHRQTQILRRFFSDQNISVTLASVIFTYIKQDASAKRRRITESEVPVLKKLPKAMQQQLHMEMFRPRVAGHPFFSALSDMDMVCFRRLCHGAMTDASFGAGDEVFARGAEAQSMYFVAGGRLIYKRPGLSYNMEPGSWASEAVLWLASWFHRGNLTTVGPAELVKVGCGDFRALVLSQHASTVRKAFVRLYAAAFVRGGESEIMLLNHSDIWSGTAQLNELVVQAVALAQTVKPEQIDNALPLASHES